MDRTAIRRIAEQLSCARENPAVPLRLTVAGGSMAPWLKKGDAVLVQRVEAGALRRGDLIVVQTAEGFLTHRLVGWDGRGLLTKGDRCRALDPAAPAETLAGRVAAVERRGKWIDLQTPAWTALHRLLGWWGWWEAQVFAWLRSSWSS